MVSVFLFCGFLFCIVVMLSSDRVLAVAVRAIVFGFHKQVFLLQPRVSLL